MSATPNLPELIAYISRGLVDHPDQVSVEVVREDRTDVLELTVDREDLGKVIGKQGRIARALREVLNAAATRGKIRTRTVLEILE
ncbi:MAG: KH domain-containing protein [Deltaproteobacteria bacterium]|nr:KH domain-containing protein [Deltaproteobacteria bacterium]